MTLPVDHLDPNWRTRGARPVVDEQRGEFDSASSSYQEIFNSMIRNNVQKSRNNEESWDSDDWHSEENIYEKSNCEQHNEKSNNESAIKIPSKKIGLVIGKGGSTIKHLEKRSFCRIKVYNGNSYESDVVITGTKSNRKKAECLISELINEVNTRNSRYNKEKTNNKIKQEEISVEFDDKVTLDDDEELPNWADLIAKSKKFVEEKWAKFPPITKLFYVEHPEIKNMGMEQVQKIREENNITVSYLESTDISNSPQIRNPVISFEHCFSSFPEILIGIKKQGFLKPSPIQAQSWPILLSGQDLIGISQTGSGKTLAFMLPALIHMHGQGFKPDGPSVLVLAPTRELALQIEDEIYKYPYRDTKVLCIYGGGSRKEQKELIYQGTQVIVATPGRLNDFLESNVLNIETVTYLVLDEADRMLDLGFEPQIRKILLYIRPQRQTVMTSATWPDAINDLAKLYMKDPVLVRVGSLDLTPVASVTQEIIILDESEKFDAILDFIKSLNTSDKVIIFCGKKATVDMLSCDFALERIVCDAIHGGREQGDRERALNDLKTGVISILIATDVASRGIDIKDITHIVNYDFPRSIEEYVHRVGRTGRAGKFGKSITYFTRNDWSHAGELKKILEDSQQVVPLEIMRMCNAYEQHVQRRPIKKRY